MSDSCDPMDYSPPGSSVHGILQARILKWSGWPFPSPGGSSQPRDRTQVSCIAGRRFTLWAARKATSLKQQQSRKFMVLNTFIRKQGVKISELRIQLAIKSWRSKKKMEIKIRGEINEVENIFNIKRLKKIYKAKTGSVLINITNSLLARLRSR